MNSVAFNIKGNDDRLIVAAAHDFGALHIEPIQTECSGVVSSCLARCRAFVGNGVEFSASSNG